MNAFGNLLNIAHRVIPYTSVTYRKFIGNTDNGRGDEIPLYADPVEYPRCSVQPVSNDVFHKRGLDLQKNYRTVFIPGLVKALDDQLSPDRLLFYDKTWTVVTTDEWTQYDGWCGLIVVEDKPDV